MGAILFFEVSIGDFVPKFILPTGQLPPQTPFARDISGRVGSDECVPIWRSDCNASATVYMTHFQRMYKNWIDKEVRKFRLNEIAPADCSNAYASISSISANSRDMSMEIILCCIRDIASAMCSSFPDACSDIADPFTYLYGDRIIYSEYAKSGKSQISFRGCQVRDVYRVVIKVERERMAILPEVVIELNASGKCFARRLHVEV